MLKDYAIKYYYEDGYNCAEGILRAGNDYYHLGLHHEDMKMIAEKLGRAIRGLKANSLTESQISDCVWTLYETEVVYCKTFYYEDMNEEDYKLICGKHTKEDTLRMYNKYKVR